VLAHDPFPYFALPIGNQRKNVEPASLLTLKLIKLSRISAFNGHLLPYRHPSIQSRVRFLLLIKIMQGLLVILADGKSTTS
jgi:hypothetical protein